MTLAAVVLLVFSLVLIAIGLVSWARLRRARRAQPAAKPAPHPVSRGRSGEMLPDQAAPAPGYAMDEYEAARTTAAYPGGMDADTAEIERLRAEIAELRTYGVDGSSGFRRTQAIVAVVANLSGILGLLVSVAALMK